MRLYTYNLCMSHPFIEIDFSVNVLDSEFHPDCDF